MRRHNGLQRLSLALPFVLSPGFVQAQGIQRPDNTNGPVVPFLITPDDPFEFAGACVPETVYSWEAPQQTFIAAFYFPWYSGVSGCPRSSFSYWCDHDSALCVAQARDDLERALIRVERTLEG